MSAEGTGRGRAAFHPASWVPTAESRFQRLENDMRDFKQAMFGASFGSATLLSCPIADSGCTEDHKSNIRTSIMLENNATTMYLLRVLLTGTFNAG